MHVTFLTQSLFFSFPRLSSLATLPRPQGPVQEGPDEGLPVVAAVPRLRVRVHARQGVEYHRHHMPGCHRCAGV